MKTTLPRLLPLICVHVATTLQAQVPQLISYQGRVAAGGVDFNGTGQFKFALVNGQGTTTFWSNDGTSTAGSQPAAAVSLTVSNGLYSVLLGDAALPNMTAIPNAVFNNSDVRLRVWFNDGTHGSQLLSPDQRLAAVGYAMMAAGVQDGAITAAKLAPGAAAANLSASGQTGVPSGGLVLSAGENAALVNAGYLYMGTSTLGEAWENRNPTGAPPGRRYHSTVWTGTEMIIWGGYNGNAMGDGARYNPATNTWTPVNPAGAPSPRWFHSGEWTGTEMIIWGGEGSGLFTDGARYNPSTNSWTPMSSTGAPGGRWQSTSVWTGTEMIVWGGFNGGAYLNDGGRYHPANNSWSAVSLTDAPIARREHSAVWTGSDMIISGGWDGSRLLGNGGAYRPANNSWAATSGSDAVKGHVAVWTGSRMLIFGGARSGPFGLNGEEGLSAVWTGTEAIVWGGGRFTSFPNRTYDIGGYRNNGVNTTNISLTDVGAPPGREGHSAVWTGTGMIIWGGYNGGYLNDTFIYTPHRTMVLYQRP